MSPFAQGRVKLIFVYTADWTDEADVKRVLRELRALGFKGRLSYKTDASTLTGQYGSGSATYVSQPDSLDMERRRQRHGGEPGAATIVLSPRRASAPA